MAQTSLKLLTLTFKQNDSLTRLLKEFKKPFAYEPCGIPSINTNIISHDLKIDNTIKPIDEKRMALGQDKRLMVGKEVGNLLYEGFVKEICLQTLVANVILVNNINRK